NIDDARSAGYGAGCKSLLSSTAGARARLSTRRFSSIPASTAKSNLLLLPATTPSLLAIGLHKPCLHQPLILCRTDNKSVGWPCPEHAAPAEQQANGFPVLGGVSNLHFRHDDKLLPLSGCRRLPFGSYPFTDTTQGRGHRGQGF